MLSTVRRAWDILRDRGVLATGYSASSYGGNLLADVFEFLRHDVKAARRYDVPWRTRISAWKRGFHTEAWIWLGLGDEDTTSYLNNVYELRSLPKINGEYMGVFSDSVAFYHASSPFRLKFPEHYGLIERGNFHGFDDEPPLADVLAEAGDLILKPIRGSQGEDVRRLDRREISNTQLSKLVSSLDGYLVTAFAEQHDYASDIHPKSANTVRIFTVIDPATRQAQVIRAIHRFGTSESAPTDNWSRGGMGALIDLKTGMVGSAHYPWSNEGVEVVEVHPETSAEIYGVRVPYWDETLELAIDLASHHSRAPFVGWDFVVTADGPVVLEANGWPGISLPQLEKGLLEDPVARSFFRDHPHV